MKKKKKKMAQCAPHRNDSIGTQVAHAGILHPRRRVDGRSERDDEVCAREPVWNARPSLSSPPRPNWNPYSLQCAYAR